MRYRFQGFGYGVALMTPRPAAGTTERVKVSGPSLSYTPPVTNPSAAGASSAEQGLGLCTVATVVDELFCK